MRLLTVFLLLFSLVADAAIDFPELTGRVVDNAGLLSASTEQTIIGKLAGYEQSTTNQVVVVTLKSLQGYTIEDFGYQLGRHWGIGQKGKDNGALLIVAPNERKVRIEVGYGLEGTLTDAYSHNIIQTKILPLFKKKQFEQGIIQGTDAILDVLGGSYKMQKVKKKGFSKDEQNNLVGVVVMGYMISLLLGIFIPSRVVSGLLGSGVAFGIALFVGMVTMMAVVAAFITFFMRVSRSSGYWGGSSGSSGSGGFGGGFSGGGGGFGGGGASGGW